MTSLQDMAGQPKDGERMADVGTPLGIPEDSVLVTPEVLTVDLSQGMPGFLQQVEKFSGKPASAQQFSGTLRENVCELSGRVCYDSVGAKNSRPSKDYHDHIIASGHHNIYRSAWQSLVLDLGYTQSFLRGTLYDLKGRPGINVSIGAKKNRTSSVALITFNYCALLEEQWNAHTAVTSDHRTLALLRATLLSSIADFPTNVFSSPKERAYGAVKYGDVISLADVDKLYDGIDVTEHAYVTQLIRCSRSCAAELNRHHIDASPSMRSTRYCNETSTPLCVASDYKKSLTQGELNEIASHHLLCSYGYSSAFDTLSRDGVAKKEARGRARIYLSGELATRLTFTYSYRALSRFIVPRRLETTADGAPLADGQAFELVSAMQAGASTGAQLRSVLDTVNVPIVTRLRVPL